MPPPTQKRGEFGLLDVLDEPAHRAPVSAGHDALDYVVAMANEVDRSWIDVPEQPSQVRGDHAGSMPPPCERRLPPRRLRGSTQTGLPGPSRGWCAPEGIP